MIAQRFPVGSLGALLMCWAVFRISTYLPIAAENMPLAPPAAYRARHIQMVSSNWQVPRLRRSIPAAPLRILQTPRARDTSTTINASARLSSPNLPKAVVMPQMPTTNAKQIVVALPNEAVVSLPPTPPTFATASNTRLKLSGWMVWRSRDRQSSLAPLGQLGGAQAGIRGVLPIAEAGPKSSIGMTARLSAPLLQERGKEAAFGVNLQRKGRVPIEVGLERRVAIDAEGRKAFAIILAAGVYDLKMAKKLHLNGYAQTGLVGIRSRDGFVDGALQLDRSVTKFGSSAIDLGGGAWVSAQPTLARLDIGPTATLHLRAGDKNLRIVGGWRFRVAGNAAPGSGPAVSVGTNF
jgi:hypothetical protein